MRQGQLERIAELSDVLEYTSEYREGKTSLLTAGEKTLIHQERAYLFNQRNPQRDQDIRPYSVPDALETKIKKIIKLIEE